MHRQTTGGAVREFIFGETRSTKDAQVREGLRSLCLHLADRQEDLQDFEPGETWERFGARNPYSDEPQGRAGWAFALAQSAYNQDRYLPVVFEKRRDPADLRRNQYRILASIRDVLIESGQRLRGLS